MPARILELASHMHRQRPTNGHLPPHDNGDARDWYVDLVALLAAENEGVPPQRINAHWIIDLDPVRRRYRVSVIRRGQPAIVLQAGYRPDETPEQAAHREGGLRLLSELLSASYGIPA